MKLIRILVFFMFLFIPVIPVLADITVKAEVDAPVITTGDLLTYKLAVSSTEKNIPSPQLPEFKDWAIVSQAQSSSVSFQKGGAQSVLVFVFILLPKKSGKLNIEAAQVTVKGKLYVSDAFLIEVKQGNARLPEEPSPEIPDSEQPKYNL